MAIQFRRSWWKPWDWSTRTWLVTIFACVVASPFVLRWICLWQVPDVTLPFDVDKVIPVNAPDSVNPFIGYQSAIKKLHRHETSWSKTAIEDATETFDTKWDDRLDQWLIDVKDVLADFLQSSEIENAGVDSLRTAHNYTSFPQIQELHALAKLSDSNVQANSKRHGIGIGPHFVAVITAKSMDSLWLAIMPSKNGVSRVLGLLAGQLNRH